jgi:hypothetical protein
MRARTDLIPTAKVKPFLPTVLVVTLVAYGSITHAECPSVCGEQLVSSKSMRGGGLAACGYVEGHHGSATRASEFTVYRCSDSAKILEFGALQTADLYPTDRGLVVIETSRWPFGEHWEDVDVEIRQTLLDGSDVINWKPRLRRSRVSPQALKRFLQEYKTTVDRQGRSFSPDESVVAKLFAAAETGNPSARRLFRRMRQDVSLDGAAAEVYQMAVVDQQHGTVASTTRIAPKSSKR